MRSALLPIIAFLTVMGCSKKDESKGTPPVTVPSSDPPPGSARAIPPKTIKLTCEQLLPTAMRDKYFKDRAVTTQELGPNLQCQVAADAAGMAPTVIVTCSEAIAGQKDSSIKALKDSFKTAAKDLPEVGAGGVVIDQGQMQQATVWDTDSPCQVNATLPKDMDLAAVTTEILDTLPAK